MSLQRRTPLRRKTELKRTGFKRKVYPWSNNPKPPQPMRQVSEHRKTANMKYSRLKKKWIAGRNCERCSGGPVDLHHKRGRAGLLLCDARFWVALCRVCHDWVHANGKEARRDGWLAQPAEWGTVPV